MKTIDKETRAFAFLASFLTIIGFVIAILIKRDDRYIMHYAKQGLVLFIFQLIIMFLTSISMFHELFTIPLWVLFFVVWVWSWMNALSGEMKHTFLISNFAERIDF